MKRAISVILFLILILIALGSASCQTAENNDSANLPQSPEQSQESNEEEVIQSEFIPVEGADYGGYKFRILGYDGEAKGTWQVAAISEIIINEEIGEPVNDALYRRNREVEALYNITFDIVPVTYPNRGDFASKFTRAVLAGDDLFDAAFLLGDGLPGVLSRNNMTYDLFEIDSLDLSKSWWDQNSAKAMSIGGKLNAVIGDVNFYSYIAPLAIFTNKQLMQDYSIDNLYQLVRDGKWTWEAMYDVMKAVTRDLNGDGIITRDDQVGLFMQYVHLYPAVNSTGEYITPKNHEDIPVLSPNIDRISAIVSKVVPIFKDTNTTVAAESITGYNNQFFDFIMPKFRDGEIMFHVNQLLLSFELRSMDADFAILPFPKYDENQANYGAVISPAWATYTLIPITCTDIERTGNILEAMGYYAQKYVKPAYYEVTVTNKLIRDEDTMEMLDIILNNRVFDLSYLYNWGDINGMFNNIANSGNADTFVSQFERRENQINTALQRTLAELEAD